MPASPACAKSSRAPCGRSTTPPGAEAADEALEIARELDSLERIQPRVDSWLRVAVGAVADDPGLEPFGEGPA